MNLKYSIEKLSGLSTLPNDQLYALEHRLECPICSSSDLLKIAVLENSLETSQCMACSHVFHDIGPSNEWFRSWYLSEWDKVGKKRTTSDVDEAFSSHDLNQKTPRQHKPRGLSAYLESVRALIRGKPNVKSIARDVIGAQLRGLAKPGLQLLDIGCGFGHRLRIFRDFGLLCSGVEPSEHRAQYCNRQGFEVANISVESLDIGTFGKRFDFVVSNHALEHVYNPHDFFSSVRSVIKPGGWLCVCIPNVEGEFLIHDFFFAPHINFFSPASLCKIARLYNFRVSRLVVDHQIVLLAQLRDGENNGESSDSQYLAVTNQQTIVTFPAVMSSIFGTSRQPSVGDQFFIQWRVSKHKQFGFYEVLINAPSRPEDYQRALCLEVTKSSACLPIHFSQKGEPRADFWLK